MYPALGQLFFLFYFFLNELFSSSFLMMGSSGAFGHVCQGSAIFGCFAQAGVADFFRIESFGLKHEVVAQWQ
jgi:hypothetical protein